MDRKDRIEALVEEKKAIFAEVSDKVWDYAELSYDETKSAALQIEVLKQQGFSVRHPAAGLETGFIAEFGSGKPVIAILGEYDALAELSQKPDALERDPIVPGGPGHGCGHNLLGAASMSAATAVKDYMTQQGLSGTVRYYGCPAEEGGFGKVFMIREGLFKDVDIALTWHPSAYNHVWDGEDCLGIVQTVYTFEGIAAHAAASPEKGRSALDACEVMNVGVNYMREHVIQEARIHYAYLDAGGTAANVVQPKARLRYIVRAPKMPDVYEIAEWVDRIAQGAAIITDTKLTIKKAGGTANLLATKAVFDRYDYNLRSFLPVPFTPEELAYAKKFRDSLELDNQRQQLATLKAWYGEKSAAELQAMADMPMANYVLREKGGASTDAGDVTWVVPGCQLHVATVPPGLPFHTWQMTAVGKSDLAKRGMFTAAKVVAMTALDFILDPELVAQAKRDHQELLGDAAYRLPIGPDTNHWELFE